MMKKLTTVFLSALLFAAGCGSKTTGSTSPKASVEPAATVQTVAERAVKDGFDDSTNQVIEFCGMNIPLPSYLGYSADNSSDTNKFYYAERSDNAIVFIQINAEGDKLTAENQEFIDAETDIYNNLVSSFSKSDSYSDVVAYPMTGFTVDGMPAMKFEICFSSNGMNFNTHICAIYNADTGKIVYINLMPSDTAENDYSADYEKILNGITKTAAVVETAAPAASTISESDLKAALDSYEAFIDEYVAFMKKYKASDNASGMMMDYLSYLTKLTDLETKMNALDDDEMTSEELAYYTEVMLRCSQKMLNAVQ
ncbi:MAG: hypothetical protein LKF50_08030 [Solobacterium sp.]|jgi:hypothetical protein|nr:hypothetical protein [Solobacterium sp.]